jgi:hypothetical protein
VPPRLIAVLRHEQHQVLPIRSDRIAIGPASAARLEGAIAPAQDLEGCRLTDAAPTHGMHDLPTAKEQVAHLTPRADTNDTLAPGQTFHLYQVGQARTVKARAEPAFTHGIR